MRNLAGHLFVLGIALLAVPINAFLGPVVTSLLGLLCIVLAVGVYRSTRSQSEGFGGEDDLGGTNCHSCGARINAGDFCEYCGADHSATQ